MIDLLCLTNKISDRLLDLPAAFQYAHSAFPIAGAGQTAATDQVVDLVGYINGVEHDWRQVRRNPPPRYLSKMV